MHFTPHAPVTFRSGLRSPVYLDNRHLISQPGPWRIVIEALAAELRDRSGDLVIAGVESASIPHSSALAFVTGRPSVFVRKTPKEHGLGRRIEGGAVAGRQVVIVEDVVTTGGSSLSAVAALREAGAGVSECLAIVSYGFAEATGAFAAAGVRLTTLTTFEDVIAEAQTRHLIDEPMGALMRSWLADPHAWDGA